MVRSFTVNPQTGSLNVIFIVLGLNLVTVPARVPNTGRMVE